MTNEKNMNSLLNNTETETDSLFKQHRLLIIRILIKEVSSQFYPHLVLYRYDNQEDMKGDRVAVITHNTQACQLNSTSSM